jgi:hypothetical protein
MMNRRIQIRAGMTIAQAQAWCAAAPGRRVESSRPHSLDPDRQMFTLSYPRHTHAVEYWLDRRTRKARCKCGAAFTVGAR